jgi:glyceraldehyde-3-phosphate dehydrogenase (NADP+)
VTREPDCPYIGGEWKSTPRTRPVVNPYQEAVVGEVCQAGPDELEAAVAAAISAFEETRRLSAFARTSILAQVAARIQEQKEKFALLITAETGKPISFSRAEVERAVFTFTVASEEAKRIEGAVLPLDLAPGSAGRTALVRRFPLGPVIAITPFNFPLNLVAHKVAPAIAAGDSIVLKPSSHAPLTALMLGKIISETSLPAGAFNIVPCAGDECDKLIADNRFKLITFTGSPAVGWELKQRAGRKRITLELGGNAAVVLDRTANLEIALQRLILGSFGNAGQSCIAVQRIYVDGTLYKEFLERFVKLARVVASGDPMDERTVVGPMITVAAAERAESWIHAAEAAGARVLCGGRRSGALLQPTVLVDAAPHLDVCSQEVFAPVVVVEPFEEFQDALRRVNSSAFGLQAALFSNDLRHVFEAYDALEVGGVIVNDSSAYRMDHMPYGGVKHSGFGREGIRYAIEEMTELKLLALHFI